MAAEQSKQATGEIPSSGGSNEHSLESNTVIVVLGASGDLAKKKVRFISASLYWIYLDGRRQQAFARR